MKSIVKWSGGKTREIDLFKNHIPEYKTYIEPFVGGGALYFYLNSKNNIISDVHKELITFYKVLKQGKNKEIYDLMKEHDNDEKVYYNVRSFKPKNDIETAFKFYYLRKTCFRGMLRYNKKGEFNIPFGRYKTYNFEELLDDNYINLLSNTEIFNEDFNFIFDKYNDKNNFMFLDPPYDSKFTDYGYCIYDKQKHIELFNQFSKTDNKCLLIIGETDFISDLYKDYIVDKYHKKYAFKIHSNRVGSEIDNFHLIIKNY